MKSAEFTYKKHCFRITKAVLFFLSTPNLSLWSYVRAEFLEVAILADVLV